MRRGFLVPLSKKSLFWIALLVEVSLLKGEDSLQIPPPDFRHPFLYSDSPPAPVPHEEDFGEIWSFYQCFFFFTNSGALFDVNTLHKMH